ncbi:MAG: dTDP-4-amino-4,6-dideoxygalactose transaminase [Aquihabitans sp.]
MTDQPPSQAPARRPVPEAEEVIVSGGIPFNRPSIEGNELEYMQHAVEHGHTSADGPYSTLAADLLREAIGAEQVLLTTSCTDALEMSALLLDIGPGDTVVVPSFGFVTTALAYSRAGAQVLFCDIEPTTLGLDPRHLAELMDDTVRAVVPIHYAGVGCDLEGIMAVLEGWPRAELVEDNAHGLFATYRDRPLGSFGRFATLSFHETKNFICGEGGALIVNQPADCDRAPVILQKGTNRKAFQLGQVDKYSWQDTGSSFGLSDVLAGYLYGQLEQREPILARRRAAFDRYQAALEPEAERLGIQLPIIPADREQAYHMYYVLLPDVATRNHVLTTMRAAEIHATFHYVPLHSSPHGQRVAARPAHCPVTDDISGRLIRLPFFTTLSTTEADRVLDAFIGALGVAV